MTETTNTTRRDPVRFARWFVLLGALWVILTEGSSANWYIGLLAVAAGAALGVYLMRDCSRWGFSPPGAVRFIPFFLKRSLGGGIDVALRAVRPSLPLDIELVEYELGLESQTARMFTVCVISLLPGTLAANLEGRTLLIHSLVGGG